MSIVFTFLKIFTDGVRHIYKDNQSISKGYAYYNNCPFILKYKIRSYNLNNISTIKNIRNLFIFNIKEFVGLGKLRNKN